MNKRPWQRVPILGLCLLFLAIGCRATRLQPAPHLPASLQTTCMKVAPIATFPMDQDSTKTYFLHHEVLSAATLDSTACANLGRALTTPGNYISGYARACEFFPAFGIKLDSADLLVSLAPCPKLRLHMADKDTMWDLADGNQVVPAVMRVMAGLP
jgi:hypothetical protein